VAAEIESAVHELPPSPQIFVVFQNFKRSPWIRPPDFNPGLRHCIEASGIMAYRSNSSMWLEPTKRAVAIDVVAEWLKRPG
jgi:hypothetical protein